MEELRRLPDAFAVVGLEVDDLAEAQLAAHGPGDEQGLAEDHVDDARLEPHAHAEGPVEVQVAVHDAGLLQHGHEHNHHGGIPGGSPFLDIRKQVLQDDGARDLEAVLDRL